MMQGSKELMQENALLVFTQKKKKKVGIRSPENAILFCQGRESEKGFFVWTNIELNREKMPGYEGQKGNETIRHLVMMDAESRARPFVKVPTSLFKRRDHARGGFLSRHAFAFSHPDDHFYAILIPPIRESASDPHHYTVETPRQRSVLYPECKFDRKKGKGRLRGCLTQNDDFTEWAQHIARVHEGVLRQAGICDAILCTNRQFQRDMRIVSAFLLFWSPSTNTFHLPCGEMSISFWDLSALCGLPVVGEPFAEYLPSNEALKSMVLASSVLDIMSKIRVKGKGKLTYKGRARLFGRISNSKAQRNEVLPEKEEDRGDWDLWLPDIFIN